MRRKGLDFSYKEQTGETIRDEFESWQLITKDAREGFHRFINRSVSLVQELDKEALYVEDMFFPGQMDLSEEWVLYTSYPEYKVSDVYISGESIANVITLVTSIDEMLAGDIDLLTYEFAISNLPYTESILSIDLQHAYLIGSGVLTELDIQEDEVSSSGEIDTVVIVSDIFYADVDHRVFPIKEEYREGTVYLTRPVGEPDINGNISGVVMPFNLTNTADLTGVWNEEFDGNNDGIIGSYERSAIEAAIGFTQQDVGPERWESYDWMDVNKDGIISESDYQSVMNSYPSAAPDVKGIIEIAHGTAGAFTVEYEKKLPKAKHIYRNGTDYTILDDFHPLYKFASKIAYDNHTDIFFGISHEGTELRAYRYDALNEEVISDLLLYVPRWSEDTRLIDLDIVNGTIYVLTSDGITSKLYYNDAWKETVEEVSSEAIIPSLSGELPTSFSATADGYFTILSDNIIKVFKGARDRVIDIDGVAYVNRRHTLEHKDGTLLKTVPSYIFNNWDSFAFSLGFTRPLGCNNLAMKKLIMDFWEHQQGHGKIGMNYGIMRELGLDNPDVIPSGIVYTLPAELTYSGVIPSELWDVNVNGYFMDVIQLSEGMQNDILLSGQIGTIQISSGNQMLPDEVITLAYDSVEIEGYFLDGNGDPIRMTYTVDILKGDTAPTVKVRTYGDKDFLTDVGYLTESGELTSSMISVVDEAELNNPFIYRNADTDVTPMDSNRISEEPILDTIYSPNLSGLLSNLTEVEVTT